jgi:twitching motility two-component system response regulator PilG
MPKVLIADTDRHLLDTIHQGLKKYNDQFQIILAEDGETAVRVMRKEPISVLVTGIHMPGKDGLQVLSYLSKHFPRTPCIVMAGPGLPDTGPKGHRDLVRYIETPVCLEKLSQMIFERLAVVDDGDSLPGIALGGFLQMIKITKRSCLLKVGAPNNKRGYLVFDRGVLFDAAYDDLRAEAAAIEMLQWEYVKLELRDVSDVKVKKRIALGLNDLINYSSAPSRESDRRPGKPLSAPTDGMKSKSESEKLLARAIRLVEGNHAQRAREEFSKLLRGGADSCDGWLWYSRVLRNVREIEAALKNAARISPDDPEVIEETRKLHLAKSWLISERVRRCPFCWSPLGADTAECHGCKCHLSIHERFFTSPRAGKQDVLEKAIERYIRVVRREKNIKAHYYLGMAHLNLERWEEALDHLLEMDRIAPKNKVITDQLRSLSNYVASIETLPHQEVFTRGNGSDRATAAQQDVRRTKVLVVEDSPTTRKVVSITLGKQGYTVLEAESGLEALTKLSDETPDLVLLDVILPGMDGYKILSIIRDSAELKHIPVIMLTSKDKFLDKVKGKMSGSNEYLTKPFDPDQLVAKVSKYLH